MRGRGRQALGALVGDGRLGALRGDLSRAGAVIVAHPVLGQKLLQVHVLELEEAPVGCGHVAIPQERPQKLVETSAAISAAASQTAVAVAESTTVPHGANSQGVLVKVESVLVWWREDSVLPPRCQELDLLGKTYVEEFLSKKKN